MIRPGFYITILLLFITLAYTNAQTATSLNDAKVKLAQSKNDTAKVLTLFTIGRYYLDKPGEVKTDMDSALAFNEQARRLSIALRYNRGLCKNLILKSQIYREMGKRTEALALTNSALKFAVDHQLLKETADSWLALCDFYGIDNNDLAQRIKYTEKAIPLYTRGNYKKEEADALKNLGDYYHLQANNAKALNLIQQSLAIYQSIHFKEVQGVYDLLGYLYARTGNDVLALKYGLMAVRTAEQVQDTTMQLCTIYNRLAITYNGLKKIDEANHYYQKALNVALRYNQVDAIQQIKFNQIILLLGTRKPRQSLDMLTDVTNRYPPNTNTRLKITALSLFAKIYMNMQQLPKAKRYVDSLLYYYKDFGTEFGYAPFVNEPIIKYYFLSGQYAKAYPYLKVNDSLARIRHNLTTIATNELYWTKIDSASGRASTALVHFQQYKSVSDSVKDIDLKKQLSILQFQFDVDNKDKDILVLKQKGQLQQNRIRNETYLRNAVLGSLIILMIILGLVYSRYNLKNKSNKLLTVKQAEINHQNEVLTKLVQEKEWLVKEIHHRVKNNLQIVISLLNTQSAYLDNEDALDAIKNSQHRMQTMSLIHQKLYQSDNLSTIDMAVYIRELIEYLSESFGETRNVNFKFNVTPLRLDVAQAVPLGLILNEAISNSIKYAFTENNKGQIDVVLEQTQDDTYQMCISDNGTGLADDFDIYNTSSLGMSLMLGLTQQLDGEFFLESKNGLKVCITFKAVKFNKLEKEMV